MFDGGTGLRVPVKTPQDSEQRTSDTDQVIDNDSIRWLGAPLLSKLLQLLLVCKQIYVEAMPYIYRDNHFDFSHCDFGSAISSLHPSRLAHLTNITVGHPEYSDHESLSRGLRRLGDAIKLKKLEVRIGSDESWLKMKSYERRGLSVQRKGYFTSFDQIPGFKQLAAVAARDAEVVILGHCPMIRTYVEQEVRRIKAPATAEPKTKSRKKRSKAAGAGESDVEDARPKKRTKRTKSKPTS